MTHSTRGRARIGVLVPFTNVNLESDMIMMCPAGVSVHFARMGGYDVDEIPDADQMHGLGAADLEGPLSMLMGAKPDVVLYGCTSATLTHGPAFDQALAARVRDQSGAGCVTAAGALVHALATLRATRIGFASPYVADINDMAISFLEQGGVETVQRAEVEEALGNYGQGELTPEEVYALGAKADHPEAEALVLSCTDMRSAEVVSALEAALGKPVICSNQAMLFAALQALGINDPVPGHGRLLEQERCA